MFASSQGPARKGRELIANQVAPCMWEGRQVGTVQVEAFRDLGEGGCEISVRHSIGTGAKKVILHWGVTRGMQDGWSCPASSLWPAGTASLDEKAAETDMSDGTRPIRILVPKDSEVMSVRFVVKRIADGQEQWYGAGNGDFAVRCGLPDERVAGQRILDQEGGRSTSVYQRYVLVMDLLDAAQTDEHVMAWLYTVLRLHHTKQLRWYGGYNYQSKDIAHLQDVLSRRMALAAAYAPNLKSRRLARMAMAFLSRGGGMSEQIRLQVLDMMRRHGIREGHRPGIEDRFLEQWHQKLHQNTTAEDITICEAYLRFLETGREGDFWHTLWERGGITRERLATMPNPITATPRHLPQLIPDMRRYLWTLKTVHAGADLHFMIESGKWALEKAGDHEAVRWLGEIRDNFGAWWIPGKVAQTRARLVGPTRHVYAAERDLLLLDAALDGAFKTAVERTDLGAQTGDSLVDLVGLVLSQVVLARDGEAEPESCLRQWRSQVMEGARWKEAWALRAVAAADRISLLLGHDARELGDLLQPKAEALGGAASIPASHVANFTEEVVRGQTAFLLALLLQRLVPVLRKTAGLGPSSVVSLGSQAGVASGYAAFVRDLGLAATTARQAPAVLVVDRIEGTDDIPDGTSAVLAGGSIDVLAHVAIRARNQGVLLACCDQDVLADLRSRFRDGDWLSVKADAGGRAGNLLVAREEPEHSSSRSPGKAAPHIELPAVSPWQSYLVHPAEAGPGVVGAKARNLATLANAAPSWLATPESLSLPFGTMEIVLGHAQNTAVAEAVRAQADAAWTAFALGDHRGWSSALAELRHQIGTRLQMDDDLETVLLALLQDLDRPAEELLSLWNAVRTVWASKWNDRAFLWRTRMGIADDDLVMAVLVQRIVPADYAFVLHTVDPVGNDDGMLLGEVVVGMGETLAGNHPGQSFRFVVPRSGSASDLRILSYPSKRTALLLDAAQGGLMVRSDCNGEDLPDSAGAGLYDSVACGVVREQMVDYASSAILTDPAFRQRLVEKLREVGLEVERAMGGTPQDIEGVVKDEQFTVVQARPQVANRRAQHSG